MHTLRQAQGAAIAYPEPVEGILSLSKDTAYLPSYLRLAVLVRPFRTNNKIHYYSKGDNYAVPGKHYVQS